MAEVRKEIPDKMPILLAGVGAQGGSLEGLSTLLNSKRSGVFVNSSRGIIYAEQPEQAAIKLKEELNAKR